MRTLGKFSVANHLKEATLKIYNGVRKSSTSDVFIYCIVGKIPMAIFLDENGFIKKAYSNFNKKSLYKKNLISVYNRISINKLSAAFLGVGQVVNKKVVKIKITSS